MAIYKDANGQWRNSDEAGYGDPGRVIAPPSWSGESASAAPSPQTPQATAPKPTAPAPSAPVQEESWGTLPQATRQAYNDAYGPTQGFVAWNQQRAKAIGAPAPSYTPPAGSYDPSTGTAGGTYAESPGPYTAPPAAPLPGKVAPAPPSPVQAGGAEPAQPVTPDQTKEPADKKRALVTSDGTAIEVPEIDYERIRQDLQRQHDEIVKQREFENELKTKESEQAALLAAADKAYREALIAGQGADRAQRAAEAAMENERAEREIKVSEMLAEGERAYKEALIAGQNADRAQKASEIAMENNYRQQLLYVQQQLQGQKLAIEQRSAQQERRRNRPFAPRPTVTAA